MNEGNELVQQLNNDLQLRLEGTLPLAEIKEKMIVEINRMINEDFEKLVSLLYRIDVDEHKMRRLLQEGQGENAPALIAELIIERQLQKIRSRKASGSGQDIPEDEKW